MLLRVRNAPTDDVTQWPMGEKTQRGFGGKRRGKTTFELVWGSGTAPMKVYVESQLHLGRIGGVPSTQPTTCNMTMRY